MATKKLSTHEARLVNEYKKAQKELVEKIAIKKARGTSLAFQRALLNDVNRTLAELQEKSLEWVENYIPTELRLTETMIINNGASPLNKIPGATDRLKAQVAFTVLNDRAIKILTNQTISIISVANASLNKEIKQVIMQKIIQGETIKQTRARIVDQLYGSLDPSGKIKIRGRMYDPTKYAEMVARTTTREVTNSVAISEADAVGSNLVQMSSHRNTCEICAPFQGRVYSLDPGNTEYPYLYDDAFPSGYKIIHPNCRHVLNAYVPDFMSPEEVKKDKEFSNRPAKKSSQSKKELDLYNKEQMKRTKMWNDRKQYDRYRARVGAEGTPKSFSGFRRMKYAKDQTGWKKLHGEYVSKGAALPPIPKPIPVKVPPIPKAATSEIM